MMIQRLGFFSFFFFPHQSSVVANYLHVLWGGNFKTRTWTRRGSHLRVPVTGKARARVTPKGLRARAEEEPRWPGAGGRVTKPTPSCNDKPHLQEASRGGRKAGVGRVETGRKTNRHFPPASRTKQTRARPPQSSRPPNTPTPPASVGSRETARLEISSRLRRAEPWGCWFGRGVGVEKEKREDRERRQALIDTTQPLMVCRLEGLTDQLAGRQAPRCRRVLPPPGRRWDRPPFPPAGRRRHLARAAPPAPPPPPLSSSSSLPPPPPLAAARTLVYTAPQTLHPSPGRAALGLCLYLTKTSCCAAIGTCIGEI
ncbi:WAS/WASL-interacting protein family member 1-like [Vombatus ursinus]|uniref:WAS/WASL-interacting protein family member 1-like n=1 Tax=Vombatus ursinus TaxID=29139 RepID=UPI000FFD7B3E|nr:WAS/WASL-interacting protein family member 1-like [Vombatus ursinus]